MLVSSHHTVHSALQHRRDSNKSKPIMSLNDSVLQISDALYKQVLSQTTGQYEAVVEGCEAQRVPLDARLRTDMDQIITSKEHVSSKMRGDQRSACNKQHESPYFDVLTTLIL